VAALKRPPITAISRLEAMRISTGLALLVAGGGGTAQGIPRPGNA